MGTLAADYPVDEHRQHFQRLPQMPFRFTWIELEKSRFYGTISSEVITHGQFLSLVGIRSDLMITSFPTLSYFRTSFLYGSKLEDMHLTPMQIQEWDQNLIATNTERWTLYVRETATGRLAGFTVVFWHPDRPHILGQGDTGIFPEYRNQGLGRWLKAAMLEKVLRERPQVTVVRTGNADSNVGMLKINHEMGFTPFMSECYWQVDRTQVETYLQRDGTTNSNG